MTTLETQPRLFREIHPLMGCITRHVYHWIPHHDGLGKLTPVKFWIQKSFGIAVFRRVLPASRQVSCSRQLRQGAYESLDKQSQRDDHDDAGVRKCSPQPRYPGESQAPLPSRGDIE